MNFNNKVAIIVGAPGGVGRHITLRMAEGEAKLTLVYWRPSKEEKKQTEELANKIITMGGSCIVTPADVTSMDDCLAMVQNTMDTFGKVDILVNTAGYIHKLTTFVDFSDEEIEQTIAVELRGVINCCKAVVPTMIRQEYGKIVTLGSDAGKVGSSGEAISAACRGAVNAFIKTLARELARYNITTNVVSLGPTDTPRMKTSRDAGGYTEKIVTAMIKAVPMKRFARPEEVAALAVFLASDDSSFITGQAISVSGGLTMC